MKGTLAGLISHGSGIRVFCQACDRPEARLDPLKLALKFGEDADLEALRKLLRCSQCKVKGSAFWMPSWPDAPMGFSRE